MDKAFSKAWAISLANPESFVTLTKFHVTASSPRPEVKTSSINIEGMDGVIDTTEINGGIHYNNRVVKVWVVTKETATTADVDNFLKTYVDKVVWLRNTTDSYQYKGRLTLVADSGVGKPRMLTLQMDAEPFKYAISDTIIGGFAEEVTQVAYNFLSMTKIAGTLTATAHGYEDDYRIIFRGKAGEYATYRIAVTQGADYSAIITTNGAIVQILDGNGNEYSADGFVPTASNVNVKIIQTSGMPCSVKFVLAQTPYHTVVNDGVDVLGYYQNSNPTGSVAILLNGKEIKLNYTGNTQTKHPELVIKHGANKYAFLVADAEAEPSSRIFMGWRKSDV